MQGLEEDLMHLMTMSVRRPASALGIVVSPLLSIAGGVVRSVAPDGGQRTARRNAWRAMLADRERAATRREAALAFGRSGTVEVAGRYDVPSLAR